MTIKTILKSSSLRCALLLLLVFVLAPGLRSQAPQASQLPQSDPTAQANQQKARAVLDRMIKTLGGQAYLNAQDSESDGRNGVFYRGRSEGGTIFHRYWQWPDKERIELTKQRDVVELAVGDQMYELTFRGTRNIDTKKEYDSLVYLERRLHSLDIILRQWLNQPGVALIDEGAALTENHSVEQISILTAKDDVVTLAVDNDSHLPVKMSFVLRDPQGYHDKIGEVYDNWKLIQGINTPFNVLVTRNDELSRQYFVTTIVYNKGLPASLFEPGSSSNLKRK